MNKKLIVGNWKMNPVTLDEAKKIARKIKRASAGLVSVETVICPPFPFIYPCTSKGESALFHIGAQSASVEIDRGPFTGEVSATMLKEIGVSYVIVGHSEQRARGESDSIVSKKAKAVLEAGLSPIICVGETSRDEAGTYLETLKNQIKQSLADIPPKFASNIILAYEPVWAIGAQEAMKNEDIYESSLFVKKIFSDIFGPEAGVKAKVLYGGSVNYRNAPDIIAIGKVDGLLVGRESVNAPGFVELLKAVDLVK
ncbi:MAG TPA: triose-phosphate isomerase [Candidatus Paceibacterota bacterium]|jgi:triosephosphate isomerase|nr:triose-phosphate isomerase [Candidatus Paceibacterota bacterium]